MRQYATLVPWGTSFLWIKKSVSSLDVTHALEKAADIIRHTLDPFQFIRNFHEVLVLMCLYCVGSYDCVHHDRLEGKIAGCLVSY